jgi:VWFA-related protein
MTRLRPAALLALVLAAGAALPGRAQAPDLPPEAPPDAPAETFADEVSVEVVNVEVHVTDRQGRPVTGLAREDFRLFEDGGEVAIEYFTAVEGPAARAPEETAADASAGEEPAPAPEAEARDPLRLVLFLDQAHMHPSNRARVMGDLERFVAETLRPDDQVMVVDHDRSLRLRQMFTTDREAVLAALGEVGEAGTSNLHSLSERRQALEELSDAGTCDELELLEALNQVRQYATWLQAEAEASLEAVRTVVGTLRGLPGRTLLVYVSDGMEVQPAADLFDALATTCPLGDLRTAVAGEATSWNLSSAMERLTAYANAQRVTLYTFDSSGLRADGDSELGGTPSLHGQRLRTAGLQGSLTFLAEQTGGKAALNANRLAPELAEAVEDASTFYSLGFTPDHRGDGRVHRLRVEVRAPHHHVRFRRQYLDVPRQDRVTERMLATLLHGAIENPLGAVLEVGPAQPVGAGGGEGRFRVPLRVTVPRSSLALVPGEGSAPAGRVVLYLATRDAEGAWSGVREKELPVRAAGGGSAGAGTESFVVAVELPPGEATVAVGLRDALGGETSYLRAELRVVGTPPPTQGPGG